MANAGELPVSPQREVLGRWADFENQAGSCSARWSPSTVSMTLHVRMLGLASAVAFAGARPRPHRALPSLACRRLGRRRIPSADCVRRQHFPRSERRICYSCHGPGREGCQRAGPNSPTANGVAMVACLYRRHRGASPSRRRLPHRCHPRAGTAQRGADRVRGRLVYSLATVACVARGDAGVTVCPSGHRILFNHRVVMTVDSLLVFAFDCS